MFIIFLCKISWDSGGISLPSGVGGLLISLLEGSHVFDDFVS